MTRIWRVALLLATLTAGGPALAQNGYSFLDADASPLDYRQASARPQRGCDSLRSLGETDVTIIAAETIPAAGAVPEHCRVSGLISPEIRFEVNLPVVWNRRFYMFGNGGAAGETPETAARPQTRATALTQGFAVASTNTGHDATREPLASFGVSEQKKIDYAFRAVHLTAVHAKRLTAAYYDRAPAYAYWDGCSTGGRQGLMEAQRFPGDFDGLVVGAPVLNFTATNQFDLWSARVLAENPIGEPQLRLIAAKVAALCGNADGVVEDPRACRFDPARDLPICAAGTAASDACVTAGQAGALAKLYAGPMAQGKPYFFGIEPGTEAWGTPSFGPPMPEVSGWDRWFLAPEGQRNIHLAYGESFTKFLAFPAVDPNFDWKTYDFDRDPGRSAAWGRVVNATDPDLSGLRSRGGKILMYFGWADPALMPRMGVDYYEKAVAANGPGTRDFFRLFMVPGMFHCRGGNGTDRFDAMTALINWVENGRAPDRIEAARVIDGRSVRSRPLCPYPQVARHDGRGPADKAGSFACRDPG